MPNVVLLIYYCALILVASILGGMIPVWFKLTHRWMEIAVSFVAGVMLGVGVLHMLPHAVSEAAAAGGSVTNVAAWLLVGMLAMFFIERFFCYHHHEVPGEAAHDHECGHHHSHHDVAVELAHGHSGHDLSWSGAALGLALHSVLNGVALAAAVQHSASGSRLAGFGTFLVIALHKPFDAMTIGMLMAHGRWSIAWRHTVNALFALAIPVGALIFYLGLLREEGDPSAGTAQLFVAYALAFSAGTFLCISLSDLLPELQFHHHDRVKLSLALLAGLGLAIAASRLESLAHDHPSAGSGALPTAEASP